MTQARVVSLLPSATEMICAIGAREQLVGVSHECDFPGDVVGLPVLTSSKVLPGPDSGAIDRDVRALLRDALAVYDVDVEGLREARPDVIVTQDLCDVCAVSYDDVCRAAQTLGNPQLEVVNLHPKVLADVWQGLAQVGAALAREAEARAAIDELLARVDAVRERASTVTARPRVLSIEWLDPVMIGGMWMPELIALAGGEPLVTRPGEHAPTLDADALRALDPHVVLIKPCGFDLQRTLGEAELLRGLLADTGWTAVREQRVYVADGNAYFNRPGPRIADSLELLAACVHPDLFADHTERYRASVRAF